MIPRLVESGFLLCNMLTNYIVILKADGCILWVQATSWKLEEAIQLFYVGNESGVAASSSHFPPLKNERPDVDESLEYVKRKLLLICSLLLP